MKNKINIFSSSYTYLVLIIIVTGLGMFAKLGDTELQPLGSAAHAAIAREILRTGDWLTLHWPYCEEFKDFYQFPPLFFWLQAICFKIFGINDITAKLVSSFFGFLVVISTYFLGKILFNSYLGFLSSVGIILTPLFFKHARKCELETILIFFVTISFIFFILAEKKNNKKFLLISGISTGLAFLAKGPPGFALWPAAVLYYLITKQYKQLFDRYFLFSILLSIVIPFLWIIPQIIYKGDAVYQKFIINQIIWSLQGRSVRRNLIQQILNYLYFPKVFFIYYLPWSITGLVGLYKILKEKNKEFYILILWAIIVFIGFTLAGYKDNYYLLLFWPGWMVINGMFFYRITSHFKEKVVKHFSILTIIFIVITLFTPIKFGKVRNPEFKILGEYINSIVPPEELIITYKMFYYDAVSLLPWYANRGVQHSLLHHPDVPPDAKAWYQRSVSTPDELDYFLSMDQRKFVMIKISDYNLLPEKVKNKIIPLKTVGRFIFGTNKPLP